MTSAGSPSPSPTRSGPSASTWTDSGSRSASTCPWATADAGCRWRPPGRPWPVALVAAGDGARSGSTTGITFATSDADADHSALVGRGVDADELLRWPGVPPMFIVRDPDGNQLKIMEDALR